MRNVNSFDIPNDAEDVLDEIIVTPATSEFHHSYLHPSKSSPITFSDNSNASNESMPSTSNTDNVYEISTAPSISSSVFTNQLTADCCIASKNSKSRRMEYSMRGMRTCSNGSSSCNPSQDSAFGSMTDGELSIASSSLKMSSFQSMSSPIDESVEETSDFAFYKKPCSTVSGLPIEPPTILVNDKNSFYLNSPAKPEFNNTQSFSKKYRVLSFEDMSTKRSFLKNVHKQNFRSLEEERRIDSAFIPVGKSTQSYTQNFDISQNRNINNAEKFKKLTHVSFASKVSTHEGHTMWKNNITSKENVMKSNESINECLNSLVSDNKLLKEEPSFNRILCKRVNSTSELSSNDRASYDGRYSKDSSCFTRKSSSERHLLNLLALKQSTIGTDCDELEDDNIPVTKPLENWKTEGGKNGCNIIRDSKVENDSTDSSPSHRSMCKIIGGIHSDVNHIEDKIPLLDGMEMSPISPVETGELL